MHFSSSETIVSFTLYQPVSGLSTAQKCLLMLCMEAGTERTPTESWRCSSPVSSSQIKTRKLHRVLRLKLWWAPWRTLACLSVSEDWNAVLSSAGIKVTRPPEEPSVHAGRHRRLQR
ncbi:mCG51521, isoform CRA_a [Mus musculus]|nr:mCG51521, isoform CRA_a [Mus musculus]